MPIMINVSITPTKIPNTKAEVSKSRPEATPLGIPSEEVVSLTTPLLYIKQPIHKFYLANFYFIIHPWQKFVKKERMIKND